MTSIEFEDFLAKLFSKLGYSVSKTPVSRDQGADLLLKRLGETIVVQAKRYTGSVGNSAVQEAVAAVAHYQAQSAWVVTTGKFTQGATDLAASNRVRLIDGPALEKLVAQRL